MKKIRTLSCGCCTVRALMSKTVENGCTEAEAMAARVAISNREELQMTYDLTNEARRGFDAGISEANPYLWSSPSYAAWQIGKWAAETKRLMPTNVRPSRGDTFHLNNGKVRLVYGHKGSTPDVIEHH